MEFVDAVGLQAAALLGGQRGGDQPAGVGIVVEAVEMRAHPGRDRGAAGRRHALQLGEIGDRQDAGDDRHLDAGRAGAVAEAQEHVGVEKELRDRAAGAGVELGLQIVEVVAGAARRRMGFGIGGDADLEIRHLLQPGDEIGGVGIAARVRRIARPDAAGRVAAQRDDVADAGLPIVARDRVDLLARRRDAGQMRGRFERGLLADAAHRRVGALARRAAGAVGHRDEARPQRFEPLDRGPQPLFHLLRLRREELERDARRAGVEIADRVGAKQPAGGILHQ